MTILAAVCALGTFALACALQIGLSRFEKINLGILLVAAIVQATVSMHFAALSKAVAAGDINPWEATSSGFSLWMFVSSSAFGLAGLGAALLLIGFYLRLWFHRRDLFPFLYRDQNEVTKSASAEL